MKAGSSIRLIVMTAGAAMCISGCQGGDKTVEQANAEAKKVAPVHGGAQAQPGPGLGANTGYQMQVGTKVR